MQFSGNLIDNRAALADTIAAITSPDIATLAIVAAVAFAAIFATIASRRF